MTDRLRDLLISLASHMAYMQGQLEARHELDDPEDYYWYRESVALRQKVTDAWADGPAVPEGREPASVAAEPSNEELDELAWNWYSKTGSTWYQVEAFRAFARAALARWGRPAPVAVAVSERLPGDELCWWYEPDEDDDGSGYGGNWTLLRIRGGVSCYTHWLPAHALPLPAGEGEP